MTLIKLWKDPFFSDMIDLFNETPSFIDKSFRRSNIITNEDDYRIQIAVPGASKENIKINVDDSIINISHTKKETDDKTFFFTTSFEKEYRLPDDAEDKEIESKMENGILEVIIPRSKKKINQRFIEIK
jgi:HSP20 family protein